MPLTPHHLNEIGERFLSSLNTRDFSSAASLYDDGATYESAALLTEDNALGRISGRGPIIDFFINALDGDDDFKLTPLDIFTGLNLTLIVSSFEKSTFVDVLHVNDDGLIVRHVEVVPKASPINFLAAGSNA